MTDNVDRFMRLFQGLDEAYGTGAGGWVHDEPTKALFKQHLSGKGPGLGIGPLRRDGTVVFSAIDLDEPNFEVANDMAMFLPGPSIIEKSRSGNAHVLVFFKQPIPAWIPRAIMLKAVSAIGKSKVEVFPKQDKLREGMVGNYLNLCYHGNTRPALHDGDPNNPMSLEEFLDSAESKMSSVDAWKNRAKILGLRAPEERDGLAEFGKSQTLHMCAEHVIANRDENPVVEGHRAVVYFTLSKQLANCALFDDDESLDMLRLVNESSSDPVSDDELKRIFGNATRGRYTSTGCDDPLFQPYAHPDCPIANGD